MGFSPSQLASSSAIASKFPKFKLDTLFVDLWSSPFAIVLLNDMTPAERSGLKYLAVDASSPYSFDGKYPGNAIEEIRSCYKAFRLERFPSLKDASIAFNTEEGLEWTLKSLHIQQYDFAEDRVVKIFPEFPTSAVERYNLQPDEIPKIPDFHFNGRYLDEWFSHWSQCNTRYIWYTMKKRPTDKLYRIHGGTLCGLNVPEPDREKDDST